MLKDRDEVPAVLSAVSCFMRKSFKNTHSGFNSSLLIFTGQTQTVWWETLYELFSLESNYANRVNWPTENSERPVHNFPGNNILTFLRIIARRSRTRSNCDRTFCIQCCVPRKTRHHVVGYHDQRNWGHSHRVEMPNGTGIFQNFQILRKKDNLERWNKIFKTNFRKLSVPFCFEPQFPNPDALVEWNAPFDSKKIW